MTDTPTKPVSSGNAEAVAWNKHIAAQISDKLTEANITLNELVALSDEFVTGGSSIEWEVAWSHVRFGERTLRAWKLAAEVSQRDIAARYAPTPTPALPELEPEQENPESTQ